MFYEDIPMHLKLTAADKTDVGKQREQNEDCAYKRIESLDEGDHGLFIVADGMGGYQAGEVASKLAVERISQALRNFFVPLPEQPTIKLSPSLVPDDDATIKMPTMKPEGPSSKQNKTRKLPETPITKNVEDQLKDAIQQANKA